MFLIEICFVVLVYEIVIVLEFIVLNGIYRSLLYNKFFMIVIAKVSSWLKLKQPTSQQISYANKSFHIPYHS